MRTSVVSLLILVLVVACGGPPPSAAPRATGAQQTTAPSAPAPSSAPPTAVPGTVLGPWVAYQRWVGAEGTAIALVRPDGSDDHVLDIEGTPSQDLAHPDWSPDGRRIAFDVFFDDPTATIGSRVEPWVVGIDGGEATRLASCDLPCLQLAYPTWSPDASQVALIRYDVAPDGGWGPSALEVLDLATGVRREVAATADGLEAWYFPRWSADGRRIVLVVERYTDPMQESYTGMALATVEVGGDGTLTTITPPEVFPREVDWSWASDTLVASTIPAMTAEMTEAGLVTMRPDGSEIRTLTDVDDGDPFAYQPSWDPAGERIVFTTMGDSGRPSLGFIDQAGEGLAVVPLAAAPRTHGRIQPTP